MGALMEAHPRGSKLVRPAATVSQERNGFRVNVASVRGQEWVEIVRGSYLAFGNCSENPRPKRRVPRLERDGRQPRWSLQVVLQPDRLLR